MEHWNKDQVREWARAIEGVEDKAADALFKQDITGPSLMLLDTDDLKKIGVTLGPAKLILHERDKIDKLQKEGLKTSGDRSGTTCKPYPFNKYHDTYRYVEGDILDVPESGGSNLIEPCHEYKAFTNTTEETEMTKFTYETVRFAAACMNSRTNGTIHFGIGDLPDFTHGQVLGVAVDRDREVFNKTLRTAIDESFAFKDKTTAQKCIKPPRLVSVLNKNMTTSEKFVIEVDVIPDSSLCQDKKFDTCGCNKKKKNREKEFLIRESGGSKDLLSKNTDNAKAMAEYERFISTEMPKLIQLRKQAEEDHLRKVKNYKQGSKLCQMITGGTGSLDKSYYEHCIIVTNKSHPGQLDLVDFLVELNPVAVLDFDPQSLTNGLYECFEKKSTVNIHSPEMYNITDSVFDTATELQLTKRTSWVFCNGGSEDEPPSEINHWVTEKEASVRNLISFLCRKDVLRNKKFLVVFLLFSRVHDKMDPLVETFCTFYQELKGAEQILCICDNEQSFTSWKNLIDCRYEVDISNRCIYELSFSEVNGTILSLLSENRRSSRFLPGAGGSKVALEKKVERQLNTLDVLCINQCEGGNEDRVTIEENFYRGGQVSWWNFYFSQDSFIKRDKFEYITNTVIPELCSLRKACVRFNLLHLPGFGGTTLAKHILWTHRARFRCALLIDSDADPDTVAEHVAILLKFGCTEDKPPVPVLLMIDDFEDMEKVIHLQQRIERQCLKCNMESKYPLVILLNCMRSEYSPGPSDPTEDTVLILNKLTEHELQQFTDKRKEMEQTFNPSQIDTFYGFMLMKENFNPEYFKSVVQHTFKSFDMDQKHAQLTAVLVLLSVYCKDAALSVSLCEQYLCCEQPFNGDKDVEEGFQTFSTLIWSCDVRGNVAFKGVRMIHSLIAQHCLTELNLRHKLSKAEITNFLLTKNELYSYTQMKNKLKQAVRYILVTSPYMSRGPQSQTSVHAHLNPENPLECFQPDPPLRDSEDKMVVFRLSPLLRDIEHETPGFGEDVLLHAAERFESNPIVLQVIATYYYFIKKDLFEADRWARKSCASVKRYRGVFGLLFRFFHNARLSEFMLPETWFNESNPLGIRLKCKTLKTHKR